MLLLLQGTNRKSALVSELIMMELRNKQIAKLTKLGNGIEAIYECCTTKVALVGLEFRAKWTRNSSAFRVVMDRCCQHDTEVRTGREAFPTIIGWGISPMEC